MPVQFINTPDGRRLAVLPEDEFERLTERAEDAADIAAYDAARAALEAGTDELIPGEMVKRLLAGENPVRVWRAHRCLTVAELAVRAGVSRSYLSKIETGRREPTLSTVKALAAALGVDPADLI